MALKKPLKTIREADKFEVALDLAGGVVHSVRNDLVKEGTKDFVRELLGLEKFAAQTAHEARKIEGDLEEGQEVSFAKTKEKPVNIEPGLDYHREVVHAETQRIQKEAQEFVGQAEQIRAELKKIQESSKELEAAFRDVSRETMTISTKPGKYHVNFFEWVLATIQNARVRIESSASWLSVLSSKKTRKDFWSLAKSHGTSYSMSSERVVAQQVG
jgi:hypothetical protein